MFNETIIFTWQQSLLYACVFYSLLMVLIVIGQRKNVDRTGDAAAYYVAIFLNIGLTILLALVDLFTPIHFNGGYWALWVGLIVGFIVGPVLGKSYNALINKIEYRSMQKQYKKPD
jgi:hypothetical protein